ncbi:MAG: translation initiation factor IF-2 [Acidimicrobiia bacterium]|nr:MAG: translation initiation factor IF-2 [Acidimicrobiia bacterium]
MAKVRVYELARELGQESKDVLERARDLGIEVKTASSGLDEDAVALVRMSFEPETETTVETVDGAEEADSDAADSRQPTADTEDDEADGGEPSADGEDGPADGEEDEDRVLLVEPGITVHDLARLIKIRTAEIVKTLMFMGEMVPGGGEIPVAAIEPLGRELGWEILVAESDEEEEDEGRQRHIIEYEDDPASLVARPAVVTVMGHVDHGKTQLLDTIRDANVIEGEAGRITQHIGAYQVTTDSGKITFIDTPGHEAFTALRARGAEITDIVIIVVAADDSVMPQTAEAISHAKAAEVPIIVAINKMDLDAADPHAVRAALTQHEIVVEELGGDVPAIEISALKGTNIDELLEMISLVSEVEELTANPKAPAVGTVIEAQLEVGRGPVATVIVQRGTLKKGDAIVAGPVPGRVRALFNDAGEGITEAGPSAPVLVMGWDEIPTAGDMFEVAKNERTARKMAQSKVDEIRALELTIPTATDRLGQLIEQLRTQEHSELRLVIKTDTHGSLEAIRESVGKIIREDGFVTIVHAGVGGITTNDVSLAEASGAIIYGFNSRPDASARATAKTAAIDIRTFSIIYELLDDVESLLVGELSPEEIENFLGVAEVRQVFRAPRLGLVAGSYVTEGSINRNARARLVRDGVVVYDGSIVSLRRFKDDVATVATGFECGIGLAKFKDIKEGDTIESYEVNEIART